ncbi:MAG: aminoglycoside phosphotransferase [Candidatus Dormiibacterota bacterium]
MTSAMDAATALLNDHGIAGCETALGAYIAHQRWAGAHGRTIERTEIVDAAVIQSASPLLVHTLTAVTFTDGVTTRYALPLSVRDMDDPLAERAPDFLIAWPGAPRMLLLFDAIGDPLYIAWLLDSIRTQRVLATTSGEIRFSCPDAAALDTGSLSSVRHLRVEQSNTSLEVGDALFLKHMRRVEPGPSQELEMSDALYAAGFTHIAPLLGRAVWASGADPPSPLVLLQPFLHNSTEGWALALTSLRDLYAVAEGMGPADAAARRAAVDNQDAAFVAESRRLGQVVAEMHLALAATRGIPAVTQAPLTHDSLAQWADTMTGEFDALLERDDTSLEPLRKVRPRVIARFDQIRSLPPAGLLTRIHGDLHLGQLLRIDTGWVVLDFEGEPDRTPAQRRELMSPLRDVAAMLRSFDYAAAAAIAERAAPDSDDAKALLGFGDAWADANRDAFWSAYLDAIGTHPVLPKPGPSLVVRRAFEFQKAVYEIGYELGHRPAWVEIPLRFLLRGAESA